MASYDLVCEACGTTFEVFRQGFLTDADKVCPACGSADVRQKITSFLSGSCGSGGSSGRDWVSRGGGSWTPRRSGFG